MYTGPLERPRLLLLQTRMVVMTMMMLLPVVVVAVAVVVVMIMMGIIICNPGNYKTWLPGREIIAQTSH